MPTLVHPSLARPAPDQLPPAVTRALRPSELQDWTRPVAGEVRDGRYPFVELDPTRRWHRTLYRARRVDFWLIAWAHPGHRTARSRPLVRRVHRGLRRTHRDRGDDGGRPTRQVHRDVGSTVGVGPGYRHDVANPTSSPAESVHAYSPPLSSMTYHELTPDGPAVTRSLATDDPEPDAGGPGTGAQ